MGDNGDWSTNSNEAVHIRLRNSNTNSKTRDVSFHPAFTYPIFGDEETIFGYKGLKVRLEFAADTLKPSLDVSYTDKYEAVGETEPDTIADKLETWLPCELRPTVLTLNYTDEALALGDTAEDASTSFEPPGELIHQYEVGGRTFGVWSSLLSDPATKQIVRNMQILVPMFIEGGVPIELDDPDWTISRWRVFLIYAIDPNSSQTDKQTSYSFAGYCTTYRLYFVPSADNDSSAAPAKVTDENGTTLIPADPTIDDLSFFRKTYPSRERISQFLILPPYQAAGHGSRLYTLMINTFVADPSILIVTVEDPNENFDDMRDINDLVRLRRTSPAFRALRIDTSVKLPGSKSEKLPTDALINKKDVEKVRTENKIIVRQFGRLLEMHLLSQIPANHRSMSRITRKDKASDANDRAYYFWRLLVKQRLTVHNKDALIQLEIGERIEKLEATLEGVEKDYLRLLDMANKREKKEQELAEVDGAVANHGNARAKKAKAKRVIEDDDEDDEESVSSKRQKVDDED